MEIDVPDDVLAFSQRLAVAGRTDQQILAVASQTRWRSYRDDIVQCLTAYGKKWRGGEKSKKK